MQPSPPSQGQMLGLLLTVGVGLVTAVIWFAVRKTQPGPLRSKTIWAASSPLILVSLCNLGLWAEWLYGRVYFSNLKEVSRDDALYELSRAGREYEDCGSSGRYFESVHWTGCELSKPGDAGGAVAAICVDDSSGRLEFVCEERYGGPMTEP